jgi:hypothetical protein
MNMGTSWPGVRLGAPFGNHSWCGTAALSSVSGASTDAVASLLGDLRGTSAEVKTIRQHELINAATRLGLACEEWLDFTGNHDSAVRLRDIDEWWIVPGMYIAWLVDDDDGELAHIVAMSMEDVPVNPAVHAVDNVQRKPVNVADFPTYSSHRVMTLWRVRRMIAR